MSMNLSDSAVETAIRNGVDYLRRTQLDSGEFTTYTGPSLDLSDATPYRKSVYVTTFVIHALGFLSAGRRIDRIRQGAADFLEAEEEDNGTWNYEGRGEWRLPADLDCTCCAAAALIASGRRPPFAFYDLLWRVVRRNEATPGGPYYTYLGVNDAPDNPVAAPFAREIDPLINANILFCCGLMGIDLPGAARYLERLIRSGDYRDDSHYVISPHFVSYAISRAYADGNAIALEPAMPTMREFLIRDLPAPRDEPSALNVACRAVGLLNLGAKSDVIASLLILLLETQQLDGSWPAWAAWAGFPPNFDGSPALTTALVIEALGKWARRQGSMDRDPK
jgi:hypothetical protein